MPPRRSTRNAKKQTVATETVSEAQSSDAEDNIDIEHQIGSLLKNARRMKKELEQLRADNAQLHARLDEKHEGKKPKSKGPSSSKRVSELEKQVQDLQKSNLKAKKKIQSLARKELKKDVEELQGEDHELDELDATHQLRKLLRRISNLLEINTFPDDGEECAICIEKMEPRKASSLPCDHTICNDCLPGISNGADETVKCPHCRNVYPRDDIELLQYTETQRWDMLLESAKEFTRLDSGHRGEEETSDEEQEEDFIDDDDDARSRASANDQSQDGDDEEEAEQPSTPPQQTAGYSNQSSPGKRKVLERLAAERAAKKRR